jgi:beta-glucosidase
VVGPNAKTATFCGGGSASLSPYYAIAPLDAIRAKCSDVRFAQGAYSHHELPLLSHDLYDASGNPGLTFRAYNDPPEVEGRECIDELHVTSTNFFLTDYDPPGLKSALFYAEIEGYLTPEQSGFWDLGISVSGTARLFVNDVEVIDNATTQEPGHAFFGSGTKEVVGSVHLSAGRKHKLLVTFGSAPTSKMLRKGVVSFRKGGVRIGGCPRIEPENAIEEAVKVAAEADQVVLFAGLNVSLLTPGSSICTEGALGRLGNRGP